MVNIGKPSSGCHMCRARRIKCDEAKPECIRCQKSGRTCPGYRDAQQMQRHREVKAAKKQQQRINKKHDISFDELIDHVIFTTEGSQYSRDDDANFPADNPSGSSISRRRPKKMTLANTPFTISMDDQTTCFFTTDYFILPGSSSRVGFQDFVFHFSAVAEPGSHFQLALSATSLASYGHRYKRKPLYPKAHQKYISCVKGIKDAVTDPRAAWDDSILASILVLTIFEQVTFNGLNGWNFHIQGAIALVKFRGEHSFNTSIGRKLFNSVRELMMIHYLAGPKAIDRSIDWLRYTSDDGFDRQYATLNMQVVDFRVETSTLIGHGPRTASAIVNVEELLLKARRLEEEYRKWFRSVPSPAVTTAWFDHGPSKKFNPETSIAHPGRIDRYNELYQAYQYNICRTSQIFIWDIILRCTAYLGFYADYRLSPEYREATRQCQGLIQDIVSSVPYCFLWDQNANHGVMHNFQSSCEGLAMKGVSAIYMLFPLHVAGNSDFATTSQKVYLKGKMAHIAESVGLSQAGLMLKVSMPHPSTLIALDSRNADQGRQEIAKKLQLDVKVASPTASEQQVLQHRVTPIRISVE